MKVIEAIDGGEILPGHAYLAPGNCHMTLRRRGHGYICRLLQTEKVNQHRPLVDVLFDSVLGEVGNLTIRVILTGMGAEGAEGLLRMREVGCQMVGQDEHSSVVYGMLRAAKNLGAVEFQLPFSKIPQKLLDLCVTSKSGVRAL